MVGRTSDACSEQRRLEIGLVVDSQGLLTADRVPPLRAAVDAACREVGRDPATLARTVAVAVDLNSPARFPSAELPGVSPIRGPPEEAAQTLRGFVGEGISCVQIMLSPPTASAVEAFAPVLDALAGG